MDETSECYTGRAFRIVPAFGSAPVGPLLRALAEGLPWGSRLEIITPIGSAVEDFLRGNAEVETGGFLKADAWCVTHSESGSRLSGLADLVEMQELERVSVYLTAYDPDGCPLFEAEDGNEWLYLGDGLPDSVLDRILGAAGGVGEGVESNSMAQHRGSGY